MPVVLTLFTVIFIMTTLEAAVLIGVGELIGFWPTLALIILSAVIGSHLLRQQGVSTLIRARERMSAGQIPATEMLEGIALAIGGALLLTPGFVTDIFGIACLIPPVRRWLVKRFSRKFTVNSFSSNGNYGAGTTYTYDQEPDFNGSPFGDNRYGRDGYTIDGDCTHEPGNSSDGGKPGK